MNSVSEGRHAPATSAITRWSEPIHCSIPSIPNAKPDSLPNNSFSQPRRPLKLDSLPTEIHVAISKYLAYPDALALKHSNYHFYTLVDTGIKLKVAWLLRRRELYLPLPPNDSPCDLRNDAGFCNGCISKLIRHRRQHTECESRPDLGCNIYETATCAHRPKLLRRWWHCLRTKVSIELWLLSLVLVPLLCSWTWLVELVTTQSAIGT